MDCAHTSHRVERFPVECLYHNTLVMIYVCECRRGGRGAFWEYKDVRWESHCNCVYIVPGGRWRGEV
jgi:hypothetical protein